MHERGQGERLEDTDDSLLLGFLHCDVIYLLRFTYLSGSLLKKNFMKNRRKVQADVFSIPSHIIFKYTKILA